MNLKLSGVGANPKQLTALGVLVVIAVYFIFFNGPKEETASAPARPAGSALPGMAVAPVARTGSRPGHKTQSHSLKEFRISWHPPKGTDTGSIDPTLHTPLLAKLQKVTAEPGKSLFDFRESPAQIALGLKEPPKIKPMFMAYGPQAPAPPAPPPPPPTAPAIPLKFYGWINPNQTKAPRRAFFLDGEDIVVVTEGETIKKRYKIVRIGLNSAVVEDTQFKTNNQQTLPLVEELAG
jgi:hypothetical protein